MTELLYSSFDPGSFEVRDGADGDGHTVIARLVPFNIATASAGLTSAGAGRPYRELFREGAFTKTIAESLHRVVFRPAHGAPPVGRAVALEERSDGLYGELRVSDVPAGRDMLTLIRDGVTPDLSIEFLPVKEAKVGGIIERIEVALRGVAATYRPAYSGAAVLAVREDGTEIEDPEGSGENAPGDEHRDETPRLDLARRELIRLNATRR